ncbi:mRNA stability protein IGO2 [Candida viswanathii]|uniref:mRNA stability protein n=1 Tax=Candida viswanathii TaxID=5486 RepID=A0A367XXK7_9ASCO|nr:mRNA stability protein IGO2 [Candida viswanathii]
MSSYSEEDPLSEPKNVQHLDLSKLSPQELRIYKMYGKLPTTQQILSSKFQDKKYFDSGDYAMQKQSGFKSGVPGTMSMKHPNAERMKEMSVRNSISATNAQVLLNGKSGLLNESTPSNEEEQQQQQQNHAKEK